MSEDWDVLVDFDGSSYILNLKSGEAYEISPIIFRFLSLLDGKRTLKEVINMLAQALPDNRTFNKELSLFLKEGLRKGFLKRYLI